MAFHINPALKDFIKDNIELIDDNNFAELYHQSNYPALSLGHLSDTLLLAGINPLEYMTTVPRRFLNNSTDTFELTLPQCIKGINSAAFSWSCVREVTINDNCEYIERGAFAYADWLEKININKTTSKLKIINEDCFDACVMLKHVELPDSLERLCKRAFSRCSNLKYCSIGKNTLLQEEVFANSALETLEYRGTMEEYKIIAATPHALYNSSIEKIICTDGIIDLTKF